jgi:nitrate/TMAO reductase-like tetraheme cytochrome c subunit
MANPGEEAAIEKELKTTIVKTPQDSVCIGCHEMQSHHGHPGFEGSKLQGTLVSVSGPCPPGMVAAATPAVFPPNPISHFSVKTCGGCHYDQYKHWRVEKHSDLAKSLPPKYADDPSCKECHAAVTGVPPTANLSEEQKKQWAGLVCEKCHGPALAHVNFNKQFLASVAYSPKLEAAARDSIRTGKPTSLCIQCHTRIGHKEHVAYDAK